MLPGVSVETTLGIHVVFIGALYHPSSPIYDEQVLLTRRERTIEALFGFDPSAVIMLGGYLNQLSGQNGG